MRELIWAGILATVMVTGLAHYNKAKAGPSMATSFTVLNKGVTVDQCIKKAAFRFKELGLTENVDAQGNTLYAESGDYTAHVRCATDVGFVYFVIAGPDSNIALRGIQALVKDF